MGDIFGIGKVTKVGNHKTPVTQVELLKPVPLGCGGTIRLLEAQDCPVCAVVSVPLLRILPLPTANRQPPAANRLPPTSTLAFAAALVPQYISCAAVYFLPTGNLFKPHAVLPLSLLVLSTAM